MSLLSSFVYWATIKPRLRQLQWSFPDAQIFPTGSRYVCNRMRTDVDFVLYTQDNIDVRLHTMGYRLSDHKEYFGSGIDWPFKSWRRGVVNVIVTPSKRFTERHVLATHICKEFNVKVKYQRVLVHELLRGNDVTDVGELPSKLKELMKNFIGPNSNALIKTYVVQHDVPHVD